MLIESPFSLPDDTGAGCWAHVNGDLDQTTVGPLSHTVALDPIHTGGHVNRAVEMDLDGYGCGEWEVTGQIHGPWGDIKNNLG